MEIHIGNRVAEVELVSKEDNKVVLTIDGKPFEADVVMAENGTCNILMDGRSSNAQLIRRDNGKSYKVNTHYSSFNVEIVDSQAKYLRMRKKGEEEQNTLQGISYIPSDSCLLYQVDRKCQSILWHFLYAGVIIASAKNTVR